jgi:hypothetical protein
MARSGTVRAMNWETSALSWAVEAGAHGDDARERWRWNRAVEVPVGRLWEVVRVTRSFGATAVPRLRREKEPLGLVLEVPLRGAVEFLVPCGTADGWPCLPGTVAVREGVMRWPAPEASVASGRRALCGRRWLVSPAAADWLTTDSDALCEATTAAIVRLALTEC